MSFYVSSFGFVEKIDSASANPAIDFFERSRGRIEQRDRKVGGIMGKRNSHSIKKFQKELDRKKKAKEKMARRQGKKDQESEADTE